MSRRSKEKHPNLQKKYTLPSRKHLVDEDYIGGVKNDKGEVVIRALNGEELDWLNQFNSEYINVDFYTMPEVKALEELSEVVAEQLNPRKKDYKLYLYFLLIMEFVKDEFFFHDVWQRKQCGDTNNSRNRDVLNDALTRDLTHQLIEEVVDEEYDIFKDY